MPSGIPRNYSSSSKSGTRRACFTTDSLSTFAISSPVAPGGGLPKYRGFHERRGKTSSRLVSGVAFGCGAVSFTLRSFAPTVRYGRFVRWA